MAKVLVVRTNTAGAQPTLMDERLARHLVGKGRFDYVDEEGSMQAQLKRKPITRTRHGRTGRVVKAATGNPNQPREDQPELDPSGNPDQRTEEMDQQEIEHQEQVTQDQEAENERARRQSEERDAEYARTQELEQPAESTTPTDYESQTVADLKEEAERRGLDVTRGDGEDGAPLKADYVSALQKSDKGGASAMTTRRRSSK